MLRLDYVSPLPPVRSGIADYSVDLLPHLAELAEVRVIRLPGQEVAPEVEARWRPVPASEAGTGGRLPLYQMGNNPYHDGVYDLALERPGVLMLHDPVLHHFVLHRTLGHRDWEGYERRMIADHGWIGEAACRMRALSLEDDASLFSLPVHRTLLRRQRGVLVHSAWAASLVREDDPELEVRAVPMGIPLPPPADRGAGLDFRRRRGIPLERPLLGSFGFQTPIKRTAAVIEALALPPLSGAHLLVVGEVSPQLDFQALAESRGVGGRVHVTGFVPRAELEAALGAMDLCLNLRYPTAGETSASLLRVLAAGRPAVVSDYAQFADLPAEVALSVPLGQGEAEALAAALAELLAAPERLAAMAEAARDYVAREHDPARAAERLVAACEELATRQPPGDRPAASPPPNSLVWADLPGRITVSGLDKPWPAGERRRLTIELANTGPARWLAADRGAGGMALEVRLESPGTTNAREPYRPWLPLPRDVPPGGVTHLNVEVRRPPGPARLSLGVRVIEAPGVAPVPARTPSWAGDI